MRTKPTTLLVANSNEEAKVLSCKLKQWPEVVRCTHNNTNTKLKTWQKKKLQWALICAKTRLLVTPDTASIIPKWMCRRLSLCADSPECLPELVSQGIPVQLGGLGTFYPTAQVKKDAAVSSIADMDGLNPNDIVEAIHIRFLPDTSKLDNISGKAFKEACALELRNIVDTKEVTVNGKIRKMQTLTPISTAVAVTRAGGSSSGSNTGSNPGGSTGGNNGGGGNTGDGPQI